MADYEVNYAELIRFLMIAEVYTGLPFLPVNLYKKNGSLRSKQFAEIFERLIAGYKTDEPTLWEVYLRAR